MSKNMNKTDAAAQNRVLKRKEKRAVTFHKDLILGHTLEQFVVLRVVLADSLCRGTGQSHEQLLGGPACLHSTTTTTTTAAGHFGSARRRQHSLPQRTRALHQAQHVGAVHAHTRPGPGASRCKTHTVPLSPVSTGGAREWQTVYL